MQKDDAVSVLNNLIETCKDGEQGFRTAAEAVGNVEVKSRFEEYARERGQMARELQDEVRRLGGDPENAGSMAGSVHRGWMNIKSAVSGKDEHAIVAEAERGEDAAKRAYEDAIQESLPPSTQAVVQAQAGRVRRAHDDVRALRDRY